MKISRFSLPIATFAGGLLAGILLISIYSFTANVPGSNPAPGNVIVSVKDANTLFKNYFKSATLANEPFKGFSVSDEEINAMNKLLRNASVKACRVYMGKDQNNKDVRMVVGIDENEFDLVSAGIYQTPASFSGPCPTICDKASPITVN